MQGARSRRSRSPRRERLADTGGAASAALARPAAPRGGRRLGRSRHCCLPSCSRRRSHVPCGESALLPTGSARRDLETRVEPAGDPELRSVAKALNRLAETLEQEEEIRKQTVADLGHELRTPVNGLLARIEAAQDGVLTGPENLEAMHDEALRLTRLLHDISRLADAEQPGLLLEKRVLDLAEVVGPPPRRSSHFSSRRASGSLSRRSLCGSRETRPVSTRSSRIFSRMRSATQPRTTSWRCSVERVGQDAVLEVRDTGIGIAAEDLPHIFTRFWRADPSRSPETGGTGIGLAIVRELVRAHDGRVDIDSVVGQGSSFRVTLRAVDRPSSKHSKALLPEASGT